MLTLILLITLAYAATAAPASADNYGGNSRAEQHQMIRIIQARFGTGWLGQTMVCIARRESGLNPRAVNWGGQSYGLLQLNRTTWDPKVNPRARSVVGDLDWRRIYDARVNVEAAWRISRGGRNLAPWGGHC